MDWRRTLVILLALTLIAPALACSKKADEGAATGDGVVKMPKEFSAEVSASSPAGVFEAKLYSSDGNTRMEMPNATVITRRDKGVVWVLMPTKMYMEQELSPENSGGFMEELPEGFTRTLAGEEKLEGKAVKKYEIAFDTDGQKGVFYQWIDEKGIPVKVAGPDDAWAFEYKNVTPGKQDSSLFELPEGYRKMEMPGSQ